jgi:hypothetical protein
VADVTPVHIASIAAQMYIPHATEFLHTSAPQQ